MCKADATSMRAARARRGRCDDIGRAQPGTRVDRGFPVRDVRASTAALRTDKSVGRARPLPSCTSERAVAFAAGVHETPPAEAD